MTKQEEIAEILDLNVVTVNPQDYELLNIWEGHFDYIVFKKNGQLYVYRCDDGLTLRLSKEEIDYTNLGVIEFCGHKIWAPADKYLFFGNAVQKKINAFKNKVKYDVHIDYARDEVRATNIATGETHIIEFE